MKTFAPKPHEIERRWYVIDAQGSVLGRLASEAAKLLRGKDKPTFAPHADTGDHVVIVNARGVELTGGKETKKMAYRHSGYPGGLTRTEYGRLLRERPSYVVEKAVRGMLPKNRLGRAMVKKLQVYDGPEHPHAAQKPVPLKLGERPVWNGLPKVEPKPEPEQEKKARSSRAKATAATPAETSTAAKRTGAKTTTAKSTAAKRTGAKGTTAKSTAKTTAKSPAKKPSTAKRTTRKKKEGDE
jgi:large subunit ribosomal protein L13